VRTAPPVSVRCSGGAAWHASRAGLPALAAGALAAWALGHTGWPAYPALAVVLLAAGVAWRPTQPSPVSLAWDGQRWQADGTPGALSVMIDAGAFFLLRLQPEGRRMGSRWIAVTAREAGPAMHALRAAAYARVVGVDPAAGTGPDGLRLRR
jgi:hypothetical protein